VPVSPIETAADDLQDAAVLWSIGDVRATEVVQVACEALVSGLDSPELRMPAACTRAEAEYDVPELLPLALDELDLTFHPRESEAGPEAAVRTLARRLLLGKLTAPELTRRIHQRFGHRLPLAERLAELDDEYSIVEYGSGAPELIDAEAVAEARRLTSASVRSGHEPRS
jgi:hypothetical protein